MYQIWRYEQKSPSGIGFIDYTIVYTVYNIQYIIYCIYYSRHGTSDKDYIEFRHDGGRCSSLAGRKGGAQSIKLAPACAEEHTLVHEVYLVIQTWVFQSFSISIRQFLKILHALGLLHEHQRPDRDNYIDVDMQTATSYGLYYSLRKARFLEFKIIATNFEKLKHTEFTIG